MREHVLEEDIKEVEKGDIVYYARIMPKTEIFEVLELKVRSIYPTYFVSVEKRTKCSFLFAYKDIGTHVFFDRKICLDMVKNEEDKYRENKGYNT